ncbi:MAG TPA: HU family DNA-binding protein [Nocardioidaceae bacterium]|nr:HU family DNA-binding protein [Nocardioidaceae bacterium]
MNKSQLIDTLAARYEGNRKQAAHALEAVIDTITREVAKGEKVAITGFGSFEKRVRDARWVRNPRTGERLKAKKTAVPKFNAGADLKAVVSGAKKLPKLTLTAATSTARAATGTTRAPAKKATTTSTASKAAAKKTAATTTKRATATKAPAKKAARTTTAKTTTKRATPARTASTSSTSKAAATKAPAKRATATKAPAKKATTKRAAKKS